MGLGRVEPHNEGESFCMTVLGLKLSRRANAVSCLHGHVSRRMWAHLWPWRVEEEIPIGHITNGVHVPSWLAWQMLQLYDRNFPAGWLQRMGEPEAWKRIHAGRSGRAVGSPLRAQEPAVGVRAPPRQPAMPPPRRKRRRRRSRAESARSEHPHDRLRPPVCHVQAGRPDHDRLDRLLPAAQRRGAPHPDHRRRQGPPGRRARQAVDQEDRQRCGTTSGSPAASCSSRTTTSTSAGT